MLHDYKYICNPSTNTFGVILTNCFVKMDGMDTLANRLTYALKLAGMNQTELANKIGVRAQSIQSICSGNTRKTRHLPTIAKALDVNVEWLDSGDGPIRRSESNIEPGPHVRRFIPLISWVQAGNWCEVIDNLAPGDAEDWLPSPQALGPHAFVLRVRGVSMEPKFQDGDLIFVDPDAQPHNKSFVIVKLVDSQEATFKQLIIEGDNKYLQAMNPSWPEKIIHINEHCHICGVVIGRYEKL